METEVMIPYNGEQLEEAKASFWLSIDSLELQHLPYFINRLPIFEDDAYEHLKYHFFLSYKDGHVILIQAESSLLPLEITKAVFATFSEVFGS